MPHSLILTGGVLQETDFKLNRPTQEEGALTEVTQLSLVGVKKALQALARVPEDLKEANLFTISIKVVLEGIAHEERQAKNRKMEREGEPRWARLLS